ncbi:MAG: hypothetical protein Kow00114_04600 [Kiloniellaceae bacterium]
MLLWFIVPWLIPLGLWLLWSGWSAGVGWLNGHLKRKRARERRSMARGAEAGATGT